MDDLTLEQAERCARALKYERDKEVICEASDGTAQTESVWVDPSDGMGYYALPLDPHYWHPRLVVRLRNLFMTNGIAPTVALQTMGLDYLSGKINEVEYLNQICEAIEALEGK